VFDAENAAMDLHLAGKTALVTGGSAGIGLACARTLVAEGVDVAIVGRDPERLTQARTVLDVAAGGRSTPARIVTIAADLAVAAEVTGAVDEARASLGRIDILVNNAGSAMGGPFLELGDDAFVGAWTLKLLGYIRMTRAVVPEMIARRDGRIVNIVGGAARTPAPSFLPGSTANAALINFTRGLSKDLSQYNVRVNAISPGSTATERAERLVAADAAEGGIAIEEARRRRVARIPLGKMTDPDEIAAMTALLVSDRVATMTGSEVVIDGGAMPGV
jgi:3-oxoacyl-[acyl-carrier protein] reductase/bacilysin biosynthesis oxidoreductase BacG